MMRQIAKPGHRPGGIGRPMRWLDWVESLAARFHSTAWQRPGPRMMWASPHLLLTQVCHRSQQFFWDMFSHVCLALRKSSPHSGESKAFRPAGRFMSLGARSLLQPEIPSRGIALVAEQGFAPPSPGETLRLVPATNLFQRLLSPPRAPMEPGVRLRVARAASAVQSGVSLQGGLRLVRRVVEERLRVEERVPSRIVVTPGPETPRIKHTSYGATREQFDTGPAPAWQAAARSGFPSPPAPLVSIERLADQVIRQIDDRMTAYRERTGKLF